MYLKRLEVKNWKAIREHSLEFGPGLNFVHGPNESGKSSLREALRAVFVTPARSRGRSPAAAARPWGAGKICPEVRVEFVHQNHEWMLRKVFFGDGSELIRDGRVIAQEEQLQEVLQESLADLAVLWSDQGETGLAAVPSSLRSHLAAAEAVTPGVTWLEIEVNRLNDEFWTPSRQDPKQVLQDARQRTEKEREGLIQLRSRLAMLDRAAQDIERLDSDLSSVKSGAEIPAKELEQAREALSSWERFRSREAGCAKAEEHLNSIRGWIERWSRTRGGMQDLQNQIAEYVQQVDAAREELGPEPGRVEVEDLDRRLEYCRGRVQVRIREEIQRISSPGSKQIERLEDLVERAQESKTALERLTELVTAERERVNLAEQLKQAEAAENTQLGLVTEARTKSEEEREKTRDSGVQLDAEIKRLEDGLGRWEKQRLRLQDLLTAAEKHRARAVELRQSMGDEPSRNEIVGLQARQEYVEARLFQVLERQLTTLSAPSSEDVARIRTLTTRQETLGDSLGILAEVTNLEGQSEELLREVQLAVERQESAESELEAARTLVSDRDRSLTQLQSVLREKESLGNRWRQASHHLLELADRLANYESRLDQFRQGVGPEPDRRSIESIRNRQLYAEARLESLLHAELEALGAPPEDLVERLEQMELREKTSVPTSDEGPKAWMWIVPSVALGTVAFALATVLALSGVLTVVAVVLGLAIGILLPVSRLQRERSRRAQVEEQTLAGTRERETLARSLGVPTSVDARRKLTQAAEIRVRLSQASPPDAGHLQTLRGKCGEAGELDRMDPAALRELLRQIPEELAAAERAWESAQHLHATRRQEYETLLKESPEALVATQVRQLAEIAGTEPDLQAIAPASAADTHEWIALVRSGRDDAALAGLIERSRTEVDAMAATGSGVAEIQAAVEEHRKTRSEVEGRHQQLMGTLQARRDVLRQQCERSGVNDPDELAPAAESLSHDLAALLSRLGVEDLKDAERRLTDAAAIRSRFPVKQPSPAEISALRDRCDESTAVDALAEADLRAELAQIPKNIVEAEKRWEAGRLEHAQSRQEYESHLKQDPETHIPPHLENLRSLVSDVPELGVEVPDASDRSAVQALTAPEAANALRESIVARKAERDRLILGASTPVDAQLAELEQELATRREATESARARLRKCEGLQEEKLSAFNRFVTERADVLDFGSLEGADRIASHLELVASESNRAREELDAAFSELDVASVDEAREREERAQQLTAQLSDGFDSTHLAQLRGGVPDVEAIDRLNRMELETEIRSLPARIQEAEEAWQNAQTAWKEARKQYEQVIAEDPRKLLGARRRQFEELILERKEMDLELPAEPEDAWIRIVEDEDTLAPVRQVLAQEEEDLVALREGLERPELDEDDAHARMENAKEQVEDFMRRERELESEIQRHMGVLTSHSDFYARLARAEESFQVAAETQRDLELQAASRKLLRSELTSAKKEVENDLVGPLRDRMSQRIEQISQGRYTGIRMEADFQSQSLLTADRLDAPIGDISFGIREQLVFLSRLCLAELLSEEERHLLVFDDNLVHTDRARIEVACQLLREVAEKAQIVMMTCHPERYEPLFAGATVHQLGRW